MRYPCSKNVCEKTIFCFSRLLFQQILNAFLYDLYHQIAHILTFPYHNRHIYNNTITNMIIESMEMQVFNTYGKFQLWVVHTKRAIHVQKKKFKKSFSDKFHIFRKRLNINFDKLYTFRKTSYSVLNTLKYSYVS